MPELTAHEEYALMMGNCPQCGVTQGEDFSEKECIDALQTDASLLLQSLDLHAMIDKLKPLVLCDACVAARESASSVKLREMHIADMWRKTYGRKLLPLAAKVQTFAKSDPQIEARNPDAWKWARNWKAHEDGNSWIIGEEGVGKTYLARAQAARMLDQGHTVGEVSAIEWVQRAGDYSWDEHRRSLTGLYFLIFDDIDKPVWTTRGFENFSMLVNERANSGRRMWITSNTDPAYMLGSVKQGIDGKWPAVQGNASMVGALKKRLLPCQRWELTGESLRTGGG